MHHRKIYVKDNDRRIKDTTLSRNDVYHIPFPSNFLINKNSISGVQRFASITQEIFDRLHECDGQSIVNFERQLQLWAITTFSVITYYQPGQGLSFIMVNADEFTEILRDTCNSNATGTHYENNMVPLIDIGSHDGYVFKEKGIKVSTWLTDRITHPYQLTPRFISLIIKCYGAGYGN